MSLNNLGMVAPGSKIQLPFGTYDSNDPSASSAATALVAADIEIYKDGSLTQRTSDSGITVDLDVDTVVGINWVEIDLADNGDAGFFSAGSRYVVNTGDFTVDAATVRAVLGTFEIGYPGAVINTTIATLASQTSFTLTNGPAEDDALNGCVAVIHDVASRVQLGHAVITDYVGSTKTVTLAAGTTFTAAATDNISIFPPANVNAWNGVALATTNPLPNAAADAAGGLPISDAGGLDMDAILSRLPAALVGGRMDSSVGAMASNVLTAAAIAASALDGKGDWSTHTAAAVWAAATRTLTANTNLNDPTAAAIADAVLDELLSEHTTAGSLGKVLADAATAAALATVDTIVDAIKAKTDSLTFTQAGHVDSNVQRINDVEITGDGSGGPFNV